MLLVEELETQAAVLTLLNGLRPGAFNDSLSKSLAKTMDKIQLRVERYIYTLRKHRRQQQTQQEAKLKKSWVRNKKTTRERNLGHRGFEGITTILPSTCP